MLYWKKGGAVGVAAILILSSTTVASASSAGAIEIRHARIAALDESRLQLSVVLHNAGSSDAHNLALQVAPASWNVFPGAADLRVDLLPAGATVSLPWEAQFIMPVADMSAATVIEFIVTSVDQAGQEFTSSVSSVEEMQ